MVYENRDASGSDLKPVLLSVSVAVAIMFGGMFFFYQNSLKQETASAAAPAASAPAEIPQAQTPAETPVTTAAKPKMRSRV
jgi:hypothetical protein